MHAISSSHRPPLQCKMAQMERRGPTIHFNYLSQSGNSNGKHTRVALQIWHAHDAAHFPDNPMLRVYSKLSVELSSRWRTDTHTHTLPITIMLAASQDSGPPVQVCLHCPRFSHNVYADLLFLVSLSQQSSPTFSFSGKHRKTRRGERGERTTRRDARRKRPRTIQKEFHKTLLGHGEPRRA